MCHKNVFIVCVGSVAQPVRHNASPRILKAIFAITTNGRSQEFAKVGDKRGDLGMEVHQRGPGAEPRWGLAAKPPEAGDKS